jgi:hypothetical protein
MLCSYETDDDVKDHRIKLVKLFSNCFACKRLIFSMSIRSQMIYLKEL